MATRNTFLRLSSLKNDNALLPGSGLAPDPLHGREEPEGLEILTGHAPDLVKNELNKKYKPPFSQFRQAPAAAG